MRGRIEAFAQQAGSTIGSLHLYSADFGGYAKLDREMIAFIELFLEQTGILLDPIYTAKMCRKLFNQIEHSELDQHANISVLHTGGLQAWRGMQKRVESIAGMASWQLIEQALRDEGIV
jgi:1-aminocyclopropane-1-carboxylate deaminase/D-cysteine desulfhydrase-like pyridoxal-dependent ACC family enzyme